MLATRQLIDSMFSSRTLLTLPDALKSLVEPSGEPVYIVVNRRRVLRSALTAISNARFSFLQPIKVEFAGEDAVDEGGPRREFLRLLCFDCSYFVGF